MSNDHGPTNELYKKIIAAPHDPDFPDDRVDMIRKTLAVVDQHIATGNLTGAENLLLQLKQKAPDSAHIKLLLAKLYSEHAQYSLALPLLNEVLAADAQCIPALTSKAQALFHQNRVYDAIEIAETARSINPDDPDNLNNLGVYQMAIGNFDAAVEAYTASISIRPDFVATYHNLMRLPNQSLDKQQRKRLDELSDDPKLTEKDRALAMLCISKDYRSQGNIQQEFQYLDRANSILARLSPWDATGFAQLVREITEISPANLDKHQRPRSTLVTPIFISSMPRAGSTLLEQLVATHPDVSSIGEAGLATRAARAAVAEHKLEDPDWWHWLSLSSAPDIFATVRLAFDRAIAGFVPTTRFVCEKSINNDVMLGLYLLAFPNSYVIHCKRSPLDICLSTYQAFFPQLDYSNKLEWLANRYRQHIRLMKHWNRLFPGRIIEVCYEDLVSRPDAEVGQLLVSIGLEPPADGLRLDDRNYAVKSASNWQIRQPIYQTSRHRWHKYRDQLQEILYLQDEQQPAD